MVIHILTTSTHYLNQCWIIVNWVLRYKLQWQFHPNTNLFIEEYAFENGVCKMLNVLTFCFLGFSTTNHGVLLQSQLQPPGSLRVGLPHLPNRCDWHLRADVHASTETGLYWQVFCWLLDEYHRKQAGNVNHYNDVIIRAMASQITGVSSFCSTIGSDADQRKHQSPSPLAFVRGFTGDRRIPAQKASNAENDFIWWRHHDVWCWDRNTPKNYVDIMAADALAACASCALLYNGG